MNVADIWRLGSAEALSTRLGFHRSVGFASMRGTRYAVSDSSYSVGGMVSDPC